MRRLVVLLVVLFLGLTPFISKGEDDFIGFGKIEEKDWGGILHNWPSIFKMKNVTKIRGPEGMLGIRISDNIPETKKNTELLLHFDRVSFGKINVDSSLYSLQYSDVFPSSNNKVMGQGACIFQHIGSKIELTPGSLALFYPGKKLESFTISFYLYPTMIFNGETVISMIAPSLEYNDKLSGFKFFFKNNKLTWSFLNLFRDSKGKFKNINITELEPSPIYEWHHHFLYYNADKGVMTLYVDGRESAIKWITSNEKENGTILNGRLPESLTVPLTIGGSFIGYMDEFIICRGKEDIKDGKYRAKGEVISNIMQFKSKIINIAKLKWDSVEKEGTAVRIMYRISNNYFLPDSEIKSEDIDSTGNSDMKNHIRLRCEPKWKIAKNGEIIAEKGRYFQWKAVLYGTNNKYTPILKSLHLFYEEDLPPSKPILLSAIPGNESVKLKWVANKENDIKGYRVYYGDSSHNYFGKGADLGNSPITLGNVTSVELKGLVNEKVYFFSITALDNSGQESGFSRELVARPSIIYKN